MIATLPSGLFPGVKISPFAHWRGGLPGVTVRAMEPHRSIVIVPSRTIDKFHEPAAETQAYEDGCCAFC